MLFLNHTPKAFFLSFLVLFVSESSANNSTLLTPVHYEPNDLRALGNSDSCKKIWLQPDPCLYSRQNCPALTEGLIDYIDLYYCKTVPVFGTYSGMVILFALLGLTFLFLSTIASDFFCPNLASIAKALNLSESVAGVTFLAFGNGSPDLFSTFSALKSGSGGLALGELIGAAWFVISVVVGSMAIIKSFQVKRKLFLRDLFFFTGAVLFMLYIIYQGLLTPTVSLALIVYYLIYVITVISSKNDVEKEIVYEEDELDGLLLSNLEYAIENGESTRLISQLTHNADMVGSDRLPHTTPITYYKRMNFWTAEEITKAFENNALESRSVPRLSRRSTEFFSASSRLSNSIPRAATVSPFNRIRSYSFPQVGENEAEIQVGESSSYQTENNLKGPTHFVRPNAPNIICIPNPNGQAILSASPSEMMTPVESETNSEGSDLFTENPSLKQTLLPGLCGFKKMGLAEKVLALICAPFVLALILTVPIVTLPTESPTPMIVVSPPSDSASSLPEPTENKVEDILVALQFLFIPVFLIEYIFEGTYTSPTLPWAVLAGSVLSLISIGGQVILHRSPHPCCFTDFTLFWALFGFFLALVWISIVATEVVDILRSLGVILGINEEIIGLTVFAMGNSLGDFVANLSVARMGYPTMAVSACFAGPMLNMMLGPGMAGVYLGLTRDEGIIIPTSRVMTLSAFGVLVTLVSYNFYVHANHFYIGRKFGGYLIAVYFLGMSVNLILSYFRSKI